jgi:hypothetical protein
MRTEVLARLGAIARGEVVARTGGTGGTVNCVPPQSCPSFHALHLFHLKDDKKENANSGRGTTGGTSQTPDIAVAERAAIAIELGGVPPAYADTWAALQSRKPERVSEAEWLLAVNDAGRFLDEWAGLALDFGWRPDDIFGPGGLGWFCIGERVRALGPDNAITPTRTAA